MVLVGRQLHKKRYIKVSFLVKESKIHNPFQFANSSKINVAWFDFLYIAFVTPTLKAEKGCVSFEFFFAKNRKQEYKLLSRDETVWLLCVCWLLLRLLLLLFTSTALHYKIHDGVQSCKIYYEMFFYEICGNG